MSKELKVVYRNFKAKYSVIPNEIILNEDNELTIWGQAIEELLNFYKERKNG